MVDSINIRTSLSQIDSTQKVQQIQQKSTDVQQQQFAGQMDRRTEAENRQVVASHQAENGRIDPRRDRRRGGADPRKEKKERRQSAAAKEDNPPDSGGHIDIKV